MNLTAVRTAAGIDNSENKGMCYYILGGCQILPT